MTSVPSSPCLNCRGVPATHRYNPNHPALQSRSYLPFKCLIFLFRHHLPESRSQGISLKGWEVSVSNDAASQFSWTVCLFQALDSLLYFYKSIRSEVWHFQFLLTQIYCLHKSLLSFKQSFCFSSTLRIVFTLTCDYIVTHAHIWAA